MKLNLKVETPTPSQLYHDQLFNINEIIFSANFILAKTKKKLNIILVKNAQEMTLFDCFLALNKSNDVNVWKLSIVSKLSLISGEMKIKLKMKIDKT